VTVRHAPVPDRDECLVAFAIGRRTGTAVVRNRIRRRLRAALTELTRDAAVPAGAVVVTAGPSVASAPFAEVVAHLARALARASSPGPTPVATP
jgi:ribonuclease P protein component